VENEKDWHKDFPEANVITARDYLLNPDRYKSRGTRIINLCRNYRYLSTGYYCALLAEARRHKMIPTVHTMTDLNSKALYSLNIEDLDTLIQHTHRERMVEGDTQQYSFNIYFGNCRHKELRDLARQIFDMFPAPILSVNFKHEKRWEISSIKPLHLGSLKSDQRALFAEALDQLLSQKWRKRATKPSYKYDIAILHNPQEKLPPSDKRALRKFITAGNKLGADVELITRKDYSRLAEYDALLIRETTAIEHHTYRFAKRAESEGMAVIDDPESIVKCTNKVYLAELLSHHKIPTPKTTILRKGETMHQFTEFPVVLKIPDGAFSRGMFKAQSQEEAEKYAEQLFKESDLILAQEFLYTDFDWRVGILNNQVIFVCKYFMSKSHWQIVKHGKSGKAIHGQNQSIAISETPAAVLDTATKAAKLIGRGLYGVDLKEREGKVYVMEVNDNPNIDSGIEDKIAGKEVYSLIMAELIRRIQS
jgi:glutathione synthase/RimK-type ligase-like ATP-grasp enzyme